MTYKDFESEWNDPALDHICVRTSGSTGTPKLIRLDKGFVRRSARATNTFFKLGSGGHFHSCVSPDFIGGKMMLVRAIECGGNLTYESPSNQPLEGLDSSRPISLLAVVPSQMHHILDNAETLPRIDNIIIGGSAIPPTLRERIVRSGLNAYETYGMTETASHIALRHISDNGSSPFRIIGDVRISTDERDCLVISYPDGTTVRTNDIAEITSPGEFRIIGRADDVIISGGKKIHPAEVERVIGQYLDCPFALSSVADEKWGERLVLVIEDRNHHHDEMLITTLRRELSGWETPKEIKTVGKIPLTPNGKLDRKALRQLIENNNKP